MAQSGSAHGWGPCGRWFESSRSDHYSSISRKNHFSFWLKWDSKTIIKRIQNNTKRPIAIKSSTSELLDLIKKRSKVYSRSKYKINCEQLSKNEIVNKIIDIYENNKIVNKN